MHTGIFLLMFALGVIVVTVGVAVAQTSTKMPKSIAIGFFGFVNPDSGNSVSALLKELPGKADVDLYFCNWRQKDEFTAECFDVDQLRQQWQHPRVRTYSFHLVDYNPRMFVQASRTLGFPAQDTATGLFPHRILSLAHSISHAAAVLDDQPKVYDIYILVRPDYVDHVRSLSECVRGMKPNDAKVWRTSPYASDIDAEDRILLMGKEAISKLRSYYTYVTQQRQGPFDMSERLLGQFWNQQREIQCVPQHGIVLTFPSVPLNKYSPEFKEKCDRLFEMIKVSNRE